MKCERCGSHGSGKFCSGCGAPLGEGPSYCGECGHKLDTGAAFCAECGTPVGSRRRKSAAAYMPWVVSGLALIVFVVAISFFVRRQAGPRAEGEPPTGGVIEGDRPAAMSSSVDLGSMTPREAADRLFDRTMRERETGSSERVRFFADMGLQAYAVLPPEEIDVDVRFHRGLLQIELENAEAAGTEADMILAEVPDHLLGLLLAARAAEARGDSASQARYSAQFLANVGRVDLSTRPEYEAHRSLIESEAARD